MNNKFSSFNPTNNTNTKKQDYRSDSLNGSKENIKDIEDKVNKYSKLTNQELMQEFLKQSSIGVSNGSINNDVISKYRNTLFPYLNDSQKQVFESLVGSINNDK